MPEKIDQLINHLLKIERKNNIYLDIDKGMSMDFLKKKGKFNLIDSQSGLKVDFSFSKDNNFERLKFKRRIPKIIENQKIYFISPEDLILTKLEWYKKSESNRHLEDTESILKISKIDLEYIKNRSIHQSTLTILKKLLKKI